MSSLHDLDHWPDWINVSNGTSINDGKQLCKFILKSIQNYRSYDPDKKLTIKCDLGPAWINVSNGTSKRDGEKWCKIHPQMYKSGQIRTNTELSL